MPIPNYQAFMRPILAYAANGTECISKKVIDALANQFDLSEDELGQMLPSGKQSLLANRVHWAITYLGKAGAIKRTQRGRFAITERGTKLLAEHPDKIDNSVLKQFAEFLTFKSAASNDHDDQAPPQLVPTDASEASEKTPDEVIQSAEVELISDLRGKLLDSIVEMSPTFFEGLVVDLIVAMGYGGSRNAVAKKLGKSGDEGIDGVVNEDPLGLDTIYIQAKRYAADNVVGREKIQQFSGALVGQSASKGVFVTTSKFTAQAKDFVAKVPQKIILIDGETLTQLMVQYGVGVRTERVIEIKRIDHDYFEDALP